MTSKSEQKVRTPVKTAGWQLVGKGATSEKKKVAGRPKARGSKQGTSGLTPPVLNATPSMRHTFRFIAQAAGTSTKAISANQLAGSLGCVCYVANTSARSIVGTVRIHRVTVWPSLDGASTFSGADCRWTLAASSIGKDVDMISTLPAGITSTRAVVFRPPPKTLAGDWFGAGSLSSQVLFTLEVSSGSIIDLDVSYTISNNITGATITLAGTATVGTFGYTPLDGSGGTVVPLGIAQAL